MQRKAFVVLFLSTKYFCVKRCVRGTTLLEYSRKSEDVVASVSRTLKAPTV